jgi:hypothetical protein
VEGGGTLIACGGSAAFLARENTGLGSVRLKRDVLDELPVYAEALQRERDARAIDVDPDVVWGTVDEQTTQETTEAPREQDAAQAPGRGPKGDLEALKRLDAWQRRFSPRGVIVAADLDVEHWLCFGAGDRLPVYISGSDAWMSKRPAATPVRLAPEAQLRLSGLMWPEARERWADTAYATVERIGNGQVILFANDPFYRAYYEGTARLFLNAVMLGPGMGTRQPLPW